MISIRLPFVFGAVMVALFVGVAIGGVSHVVPQPMYIGGPGGGLTGGQIIVNVPDNVKVVQTTIGCAGGVGEAGYSVVPR